jgi:ABC-type ATPase with predicted acetyltransferase domain
MGAYTISKTFCWQGQITDKVAGVMKIFGLTVDRLAQRSFVHNCSLHINDGDIVYISGPSGAGKSVLLNELERSMPVSSTINLARISLPNDKTLIDCIDGDVMHGLRVLGVAGLNDCFCILNQPCNLSDGQRYRFRLAIALAAGKKVVFADEFCSNLDHITAAVISHNIRKFATRTGATFVLAASRDDILCDLAPDVLVVKELAGPPDVIYKRPMR